jgi:hypothetical protein
MRKLRIRKAKLPVFTKQGHGRTRFESSLFKSIMLETNVKHTYNPEKLSLLSMVKGY